jgi:sporulation protein YlmC with PRC-barrel domain
MKGALDMKSLIPMVTAVLFSVTLAGNSYAGGVKEKREELREERQDVREKQRELQEAANEEMQEVSRASKIIGTDVKNTKGEDLGDIKDLVLDPTSGRLAYVVVSYGGMLGMGDKLFAIPWNAVRWSTDKDYFTLNMDKEALKNAPGFDEDHWPASAAQWQQQRGELNRFYRVNP